MTRDQALALIERTITNREKPDSWFGEWTPLEGDAQKGARQARFSDGIGPLLRLQGESQKAYEERQSLVDAPDPAALFSERLDAEGSAVDMDGNRYSLQAVNFQGRDGYYVRRREPAGKTAEVESFQETREAAIRDAAQRANLDKMTKQTAVRPLGRDEIGEAPNGATAENADWQYQKRLNGWWFSKNGGEWQRVPDRGQNSIERLWEEQNPEEAARTRDPEYPNETAREQRARLLNMFPENEREEARKWGLVRLREEAPAVLRRRLNRHEAMERMIEEDMRRFMDELRSNLQAVSPGGTTYTLQPLKSKPAGRYRVNAVTPAGSPSVVVNKGVPLEEALERVREKVNDEMSGRRLDADFWETMNARLDAEEKTKAASQAEAVSEKERTELKAKAEDDGTRYSKTYRSVAPKDRANIEAEIRESPLGKKWADKLLGDKGQVRILDTQAEARKVIMESNEAAEQLADGGIIPMSST